VGDVVVFVVAVAIMIVKILLLVRSKKNYC
jgi:hypothetical protein